MKEVFKNIVKYLRELSVVVLGVAITLGLNDWIGSRNEQKDMQRYIDTVRLELEENLVIMQDMFNFYDYTGKFAKYLFAAGKQENLQADSLAKYVYALKGLKYLQYDASAFEMLKSAGAMRLIKDKDLLKSIVKCYRIMEYAKSVSDNDMLLKQREMFAIVMEKGAVDIDLQKPEYVRMYNYFAIYTAGEGLFLEGMEQIEKTLALF